MSGNETASSHALGAILLTAITLILAVLVLLMAPQLPEMWHDDPVVPAIFEITRIKYTLSTDGIYYIGLVVILNTDSANYRNRNLKVITYVNGEETDCRIPTLNNNLFCQMNHNGVWHVSGVGTWGGKDSPTSVWPANSEISIEYQKGRLHPGDQITLEFIDTTTNRIISRDTYPHAEEDKKEKLMKLYLSHQGA